MSACNCCSEPPCGAVFLEADQTYRTLTKCYYWNFADGKYYKQRTTCNSSGTLVETYTRSGVNCTFSSSSGYNPPTCPVYTTTYANEESTDDLVTLVEDNMPAFPDVWWWYPVSGKQFGRNIADDINSCTITRLRWRLSHAPTGTGYLKVWLNARFQGAPVGGVTPDPVNTPITPYIWTGTGNPCLADLTKPYDAAENKITSTPVTQDEPPTEGTITIQVVKTSCVPGYEPDISDEFNEQPWGYPDPTWEAVAP